MSQCYNFELRAPLTNEKNEVLKWLLRETFEQNQLQSATFLETSNGTEGSLTPVFTNFKSFARTSFFSTIASLPVVSIVKVQ
jgi:hypothetical protein